MRKIRKTLTSLYDYCIANNKRYIIDEWHPTQNSDLRPMDIAYGTGQKVWWKCSKGHEWQASANDRTHGNNCPFCSNQKILKGYNDLATTNPKLAAEWHPTKNGNLTATDIFANTRRKVWWLCSKGHAWEAAPYARNKGNRCPICNNELTSSFPEQAILYYLNKEVDCESRTKLYGKEADIFIPTLNVAIEYDGQFFHNNQETAVRDKNKTEHFIKHGIKLYRVKECDKNGIDETKGIVYCITDQDYSYLKRVIAILSLWILGKEIKTDIKNDTSVILAQYLVLEKENSIIVKCPEAKSFWNTERNGTLLPDYLSYSSAKKVWWKCDKGHEWQTTPAKFFGGERCPFCSNHRVLQGFNDLATTNPQLANEWHPTKNGLLKLTEVSDGSHKKVWWLCDRGHEWQAPIYRRVNGNNCPYCSGRLAIVGANDLATVNSELSKEWHPTKNGSLKPVDVKSMSNTKVWWVGQCGHEWQSTVAARTIGGGCPICAGKQVLKGYNDLATTNPKLTQEWNYKRNEIKPTEITSGSSKKVWWICEKGHEWQAAVNVRTRGNNCPICSNQQVLKGYNDLATTNPKLTQEWNYEKNEIKPTEVASGSDKKVWWICEKGHEWQASIYSRNNGLRCPICSNKQVLTGFNDLETINPKLASEWHPTKNDSLKPSGVSKGSKKKVWWVCNKGHEWQAAVEKRSIGRGCPYCANRINNTIARKEKG